MKSETRLRPVQEEDYSLMIPNAGGVLSKADELKSVEERLKLKLI